MSADAQIYNDATFTIDGVPFATGMVTAPRAKADEPMRPADLHAIATEILHGPSVSYEAHGTMEIGGDALDSLIALLKPRETGASNMTLARRVGFGGRKGRSALRRLHAKGFVGVLVINDERPVPCPPVTISTENRTVVVRGRRRR